MADVTCQIEIGDLSTTQFHRQRVSEFVDGNPCDQEPNIPPIEPVGYADILLFIRLVKNVIDLISPAISGSALWTQEHRRRDTGTDGLQDGASYLLSYVWKIKTVSMDYIPERTPDSIEWFRDQGETPTIVSISDIHGYLEAARNALTAVGETKAFDPLVTTDDEGRLHWAGNDYLLVVNGDLIDRGDKNRECLALLERLAGEAPPGRVRYHLGNHEMAVLFPEQFGWPGVYSIELADDLRRSFIEHVAACDITVAFEGYHHVYSHAGANEPFDVTEANDQARQAAQRLVTLLEEGRYDDGQLEVEDDHELVFETGGAFGRGPSAGLLWMDFRHMKENAPPQIVGHSRHRRPTRTGNAICQNVIRDNLDSPGGEAVLLESPDDLVVVTNTSSGATVSSLE